MATPYLELHGQHATIIEMIYLETVQILAEASPILHEMPSSEIQLLFVQGIGLQVHGQAVVQHTRYGVLKIKIKSIINTKTTKIFNQNK